MPNEPERDIEKLLKACAQKRRAEAGAPLEMHPATRRMMQGEVARQTARAPRAGGLLARFLAELRPRLAFGGAVLVVVVVGTWALVLSEARRKTRLAQNKPTQTIQLAKQITPAPAAPLAAPAESDKALNEMTVAYDASRLEDQKKMIVARGGAGALALEEKPSLGVAAYSGADKKAAVTGPEIAGVAKDEAKGTLLAGRTEGAVRPDTSDALGAERFGLAKTPAPTAGQSAVPQELPATDAPLLARRAPATEPSKRALAESESHGEVAFALKPPPGSAASLPSSPATVAPLAEEKQKAYFANLEAVPPASFTQKFVQVDSRTRRERGAIALKTAQAEEILASFQVTQAGDTIQVIDSDGSAYTGFVQRVPAPAGQPAASDLERQRTVLAVRAQSAKELQADRMKTKIESPMPAGPGYFFRVAGTNSRLNQQVVFSGNMLVDTNALAVAQSNAAVGAAGAYFKQQAGPIQPELQNARITGQAVIDNVRTIEVNATPVTR
jgi:hypothetical protein